jgi:hydroxymethylpyrimidine/phosphomethylpyrimidine kinase
MLDTTEEFRKKQIEIILSKTPAERAKMGMEMIDTVYYTVKNSIKTMYPHYTEKEVIAELFRRYYKDDFPTEKVMEIMERIRNS